MKRKSLHIFLLVCLGLIGIINTANSQCAYTGTVYGTAAAPTASCTAAFASPGCHYVSASGDLAAFTGLVAGNTYLITTSGTSGSLAPNTDFLTAYLSTATAAPVATGSGGTLTFTPTVSGTYHIVIATAAGACATTNTSCRYPSIQCTSCAAPVIGAATNQPSTAVAQQGAVNAQVLRVDISGTCNSTLTAANFNLGTTTMASDITAAKVYYTTTTTFSTTTQFGTTVANPSGAFTVNGSQLLPNGATSYLWLVYDVNCNATPVSNVLDASCVSVVTNTGTGTPATSNPAGTRTVSALFAPTYTNSTAGNYGQGTVNAQKAYINISGATACPANVTSVTFNTGTSTNPAVDISQAKCFYTTSTTFSAATPFGTAVSNPNGAITFTGTQAIANGTGNYFWLVYDVACGAVVGDSINSTVTNIVLNGSNTLTPTGTSYSRHAVSANVITRTDGNGTTAVNPGAVHAPFAYATVPGSTLCGTTVSQVDFTVAGTATTTDIARARCYYTTTTTFSNAVPFGTAIPNPATGTISFSGNQALANGNNYFWLTYDVSCSAVATNTLNGDVASITVNGTPVVPTGTAPAANAISAVVAAYATINDGNWSDVSTWNCGAVPPTNTTAVTLGHNVTVNAPGAIAGDVTVVAGKTLTIAAGGDLTMGASSSGAAAGNSNKLLTVNGTLNVSGGTLNLNGGAALVGSFIMSAGTINVDPNDGASASSFANSNGGFYIAQGTNTVNVTGGNINFLDPMYTAAAGTGQSVLGYSNTALDATFGTGCTVTFGGGDDQNAANTNGFYPECNLSTGTLELSTVIINTGRVAAQRQVTTRQSATNYITKVKNLTINAGSELSLTAGSAPFCISGNLVNNGVITNAAAATGSGLFFADLQYSSGVLILPLSTAQSISGTGVFKKSAADGDPTAQTGNVIGGMTVYHLRSSPGLTLNMPITATAFLRFVLGKVNTTATNFLALGHGTAIPGNPATFSPTTGTVYGFSATAPTNLATYLPGGWVVGPFSRYVPATTTLGQQGIMPVGSDTSRPTSVLFTAAPTAAGYLTAQWSDADGGVNGMPLNEPAVTPSTLTNVAPGYWNVSQDGSLSGGTYDITATNTQASLIYDYLNTSMVKRADATSPWTLQGTHVATTGSNTAPTVRRNGMTGFSEFAIAGNTVVIPVVIEYFRGAKQGATNRLDWKVSCYNTPSATLSIERSADGRTFNGVYSIVATALRCQSPFDYTDNAPLAGMNYYRLKMTDADGKVNYSSIVALLNKDKGFAIVGIAPNPVTSGTFKLNITTAQQQKLEVVIADIQGRVLSRKVVNLAAGFTAIDMNVSSLANGTYQLYGILEGEKTKVLSFVKQ